MAAEPAPETDGTDVAATVEADTVDTTDEATVDPCCALEAADVVCTTGAFVTTAVFDPGAEHAATTVAATMAALINLCMFRIADLLDHGNQLYVECGQKMNPMSTDLGS